MDKSKIAMYFIVFSMGFTTGTIAMQVINNELKIPAAITSAILLSVSTVLFIFRVYEDEDTKLLRMYKKAGDALHKYEKLLEEGKP